MIILGVMTVMVAFLDIVTCKRKIDLSPQVTTILVGFYLVSVWEFAINHETLTTSQGVPTVWTFLEEQKHHTPWESPP